MQTLHEAAAQRSITTMLGMRQRLDLGFDGWVGLSGVEAVCKGECFVQHLALPNTETFKKKKKMPFIILIVSCFLETFSYDYFITSLLQLWNEFIYKDGKDILLFYRENCLKVMKCQHRITIV